MTVSPLTDQPVAGSATGSVGERAGLTRPEVAPLLARALRGWAVDLIREGVPIAELWRSGDKATWRALTRIYTSAIQTSAIQRGWTLQEAEGYVMAEGNRLGRQVSHTAKGSRRSPERIMKQHDSAWAAAMTWVAKRPAPAAPSAMRTLAEEKATAVLDALQYPEGALADLSAPQRAVLDVAARQAASSGVDRLALPSRAVAASAGITDYQAKLALTALGRLGLLALHDSGKASADPDKRRAATFSLLPGGTEAFAARLSDRSGPPMPEETVYARSGERSMRDTMEDPACATHKVYARNDFDWDGMSDLEWAATPAAAQARAAWATRHNSSGALPRVPHPNAPHDLEVNSMTTLTVPAEHASEVAEFLSRLVLSADRPAGDSGAPKRERIRPGAPAAG